MPTLPERGTANEFLTVILPYATLFCKRVFGHVQLLLTGAILTPGKRTISSVLRIMGEGPTKTFHKYHGTGRPACTESGRVVNASGQPLATESTRQRFYRT